MVRLGQAEVNRVSAVSLAQRPSGVLDEDAAHQLRRDGEEEAAYEPCQRGMSTVLPVDVALPKELEVRFVDDGRRVEPILPPFAGQLA